MIQKPSPYKWGSPVLFVLLTLALSFLSCDMLGESFTASEDISKLKIAFLSHGNDDSGDWLLYMMNSDGSDRELVTDIPVRWSRPAISPDAQNIVIEHYSDINNQELYMVHLPTKQVRLIAQDALHCVDPNWSPLGDKIVYVISRDDTSRDYVLRVMDVGSGSEDVISVEGSISLPEWSPDGSLIAFVVSQRDDDTGITDHAIHVARPDGSSMAQITDHGSSPQWSPDGRKIAFTSQITGSSQIYVMNADGSGEQQLTNSIAPGFWHFRPPGNHSPVWSPDSKAIAYLSYPEGEREIFEMQAGGSLKRRLTNSPEGTGSPVWSPEGDYILFSSSRNLDMRSEIYVMHRDGSEQRPLTDYWKADVIPQWLYAK